MKCAEKERCHLYLFTEHFLKNLGKRETKIKTASESGPLKGTFGTPENFIFADGQTGVGFGKSGEAVFANGLTENLASVGRLCEKGFFVLFGAERYQIFSEENFSYEGRVVHSEARDRGTGLYPLTVFKKSEVCTDLLPVCTREGEIEPDKLRKFFNAHTQWAEAVCEAERRQGGFDTTLQKLSQTDKNLIFQNSTQSFLARFIVSQAFRKSKPGTIDWH